MVPMQFIGTDEVGRPGFHRGCGAMVAQETGIVE
jgi:hypothetical protein